MRREITVTTPQEPEHWFVCGDERQRVGENGPPSIAHLGRGAIENGTDRGRERLADVPEGDENAAHRQATVMKTSSREEVNHQGTKITKLVIPSRVAAFGSQPPASSPALRRRPTREENGQDRSSP